MQPPRYYPSETRETEYGNTRVRLTRQGITSTIAPPVPSRISSWMITIGTHTKPYGGREGSDWQRLEESLNQVIHRIFQTRPTLIDEIFYKVRTAQIEGARRVTMRDPDQTGVNDGVISLTAHSAIELGERQRRIDAHIIIRVKHRLHLQIDHNRLGEIFDQELARENTWFEGAIYYTENPATPARLLRWANPSVYVSFRSLGHIDLMSAARYIGKQRKSDAVLTERDVEQMLTLNQQAEAALPA